MTKTKGSGQTGPAILHCVMPLKSITSQSPGVPHDTAGRAAQGTGPEGRQRGAVSFVYGHVETSRRVFTPALPAVIRAEPTEPSDAWGGMHRLHKGIEVVSGATSPTGHGRPCGRRADR